MLLPILEVMLILLIARLAWRSADAWVVAHADVIEAHRARNLAHAEQCEEYLNVVHFGWYQAVVIFAVASFVGLLLEQVWMFATAGLTDARYGLVWGPFSPLYGFGALLFTYLCLYLRDKNASKLMVFLVSMLVGATLEQITGWSMETFMGAVSWDYSSVPGAVSKWVCIPFCCIWGLIGFVWKYKVMPEMLFRIGEPTHGRQAVFVMVLGIYLALDIAMTLACFARVGAREHNIPPSNAFEQMVDTQFNDEFVANRFQNMEFRN